jgi:mitofusin 2
VKHVMEAIYDKCLKTRAEKMLARKEFQDKFNFTEQQLMLLTQEMKDKIHQMVEDVEQRVSRNKFYLFF